MKYHLVESGSKGNCCVVTHKDSAIVIDCGGTKRYLTQAFKEIDYDIESTDALLVTHGHSDHVSQVKMFQKFPIYTMQNLNVEHYNTVVPFEVFQVKGFEITVLPLSHDCPDTIGFLIEADGEKLVYITDTGYVKQEVQEYMKDADYYIMESNHDIEMLMQTNRPAYLKQRIAGDSGHLCNEDSAHILSNCLGDATKEIVLAHISEEGNSMERAYDSVVGVLKDRGVYRDGLRIIAAEQFGITKGGK